MKKERNAEPKLAPDGFDPLSESLAEKAKGTGADEEKQNGATGDPAQEPHGENSSGEPNVDKEPNAGKDPKDGTSAGTGRNADGREGENAGQEKNEGPGASGGSCPPQRLPL